MRITGIEIDRFGVWQDFKQPLHRSGLTVFYGPNEAGKTTLLEFLRGLLFDFPPRTPYDFGDKGEMAGVAQLELHDGRAVELRRRKGNKDKVAIKLDGQPAGMDTDIVAQGPLLLGGGAGGQLGGEDHLGGLQLLDARNDVPDLPCLQ